MSKYANIKEYTFMRRIVLWTTAALFVVSNMATAFEWEDGALNVDLSSEAYYQSVWGNEYKSTLEEGWMHLENLVLDINQGFGEKAKFQGYANFRSSNDPQHQINERDLMFVEGYARLADDYEPNMYELWCGDYAEDYSSYMLSTSLLGAKAFYKYNDWVKVSTLFGRNRDESLDGYVRYTTGGKVESNYKDYLTIGVTAIHTDVERDSLGADSSIGDQFNQVYGGDLHLKLLEDRLHFDAEYAQSIYNDDTRDDSLEDQKDSAVLVKGDISPIENLMVSAAFERVEPWFHSILGSASPDLQRIFGQVDYFPGNMLSSATLLHEYSFNKINSHSIEEYRTYTHMTSFSSSISPFYTNEDIWNSLNVDFQVDHSKYYTKDHPRTIDQNDLSANLVVSQSFNKWDYSLGHTNNRTRDRVVATSEIYSHNPFASVGINYPWLSLDWSWNFNGGYEYRKYIYSRFVDKIYRADGGLSLFYDTTRSTLMFSGAIEYADNASDPVTGAPDTITRSYSATFEQLLLEKEVFSANLTLRANYMEYDEDAHGEDYNEAVYYMGLTMKF
jgi:hypothetical protein